MQKIILLSIAAFLHLSSYAQTNLKDSLKFLLQKEKRDTSRVMLLTGLSFVYVSNKPDSAMLLALEALAFSQRIGFVKGEASSFNLIGLTYDAIGNHPKAMEFSLQSLILNEKINNLEGISRSINNLGNIYREQEEYHQAIDYYLKSKKINEQLKNADGIAVNLGNLGRSYLGLKQYDSARVYTHQAYEIASKFNYDRRTGNFLSLMGDIYSETGQKQLALEYYRLSLPYIKLTEQFTSLSYTFLGIAKLFENEGQMDSTLFYANQAFKISSSAGFTDRVLNTSSFLSSFYMKRRNVDSAFFYLQVAKAANDSIFSQQRINQFQSLKFDEKIRQKEIAAAEIKAKTERKHNLQFSAIVIGLISFVILFFVLSRSIMVKTKFIEFFGVLGLLAVFEFINLFIHPYLALVTNESPVLMLGVLIAIGALLIPLHHRLEKWITKVMVEKNKKIRLDSAKKTIANMEGEQTN